MIPELRARFNANFTPALYAKFLAELNARCGTPVQFRNSETPCFFPASLLAQMAVAGAEMVTQLLANPDYLARADQSIPPEFRVPQPDPRPLFVQADFGVVQNEAGDLEPRLVEIQGFPSLYAYQVELANAYSDVYRLPPDLHSLFGTLNPATYRNVVRRAILGTHAPENVVLLEIDPLHQKTLPDFLLTERMCGIRTVDITQIRKEGNRLFHNGIPIHRIYNRTIADELIRRQIPLAFDFRDDLQVEWAGHPNWFFRISKFSLPYLHHPFVPASEFLDRIPPDPENFVLKPLFSFAGLGVIVGPTRGQIESIPREQRSQYLLQQRVAFQPVIETPFGPTNAEVRIMYIWTDRLQPVTTIVRMGRGKMMGVDHNRDLEWVGASAGFSPAV
jgi:hypothetical protein